MPDHAIGRGLAHDHPTHALLRSRGSQQTELAARAMYTTCQSSCMHHEAENRTASALTTSSTSLQSLIYDKKAQGELPGLDMRTELRLLPRSSHTLGCVSSGYS
eukprot:5059251-Pleurochrysis_carterae.AAC.1